MLRQTEQHPMLRTQFCRTAFHGGTTNDLGITLDIELSMFREQSEHGAWCRDLSGYAFIACYQCQG